jgi:exoribonuclease R
MAESDQRAKKYERGVVDLLEALVLSTRIGQTFTGTVIEIDRDGTDGVLILTDPAVEARVSGAVKLGEEMTVRLVAADTVAGTVQFAVA